MIDFSLRTFKDYLKKPLEKQEINFLIKTFSRSCLFFFFFMVFVIFAGISLMGLFKNNQLLFLLANAAVFVVSSLVFFFLSLKYRLDPLGVSHSTISTCWTLLIVVFTSLFLSLTSFCFRGFDSANANFPLFLTSSGLLIFLITIALYAIPVMVGLHIQNKKTIISLVKFLKICGILYLVFFLISIVSSCLLMWYKWQGLQSAYLIPFALYFVFVFLSPIVTIYRMKTIVPYINYEDDHERNRWQNFFVFEIVEELLHMAYTVAKFLVYFFSRGPGSRLG